MAYESRVLENAEVDGNGNIVTVPKSGTLALDNSNSSASKHFFVEEKDSNGNCLVGVYGEEMVWDFDLDELTEFTDKDGTVSLNYGTTTNYHITNGNFKGMVIEPFVYAGAVVLDDYVYRAEDGLRLQSDNSLWANIWTGNGFGDSNTFDMLTNGTSIDLNGNTVRIFHGAISLNGKDI